MVSPALAGSLTTVVILLSALASSRAFAEHERGLGHASRRLQRGHAVQTLVRGQYTVRRFRGKSLTSLSEPRVSTR